MVIDSQMESVYSISMTFWWPQKGLFMSTLVTMEHFDAEMSNVHNEVGTLISEFEEFRSENASRQDEMVTILRRLDQERMFTVEWIRRIESDVSMMKKHFKLE